jgi:hypothetical protein
MAATLLPSLNEGLMGLREKHPVLQQTFDILFFNEGSHFIQFRDPRKIYGGGSLRHLNAPHMRDVATNQ